MHFLSAEEIERLGRFSLLQGYLQDKQEELDAWNAKLEARGKEPVNTRRMTNLGTFRAYMVNYLRASERLRQDLTMIVRQLGPGPEGLPFEIYCFTNTVEWVAYEGIQSDIFDHILAILPEFGLQVFQQPSGVDMQALARGRAASDRDDGRSLKHTPDGEPGAESAGDSGSSSGHQTEENAADDSQSPDDPSTKQEES